MFSIKDILENQKYYKEGLVKRGFDISKLESVISLGTKRSKVMKETQLLEKKRNEFSKEIGILKSSGQNADKVMAEVSTIKLELEKVKEEANKINAEINNLLLDFPNIPSTNTPVGDEKDNVVIKTYDKLGKGLIEDVKPHYELATELNIVDFDRAVKIASSRFWSYIGDGAKLVRALQSYFLDKAVANGFVEVNPPVLVNSKTMIGTGQLPKFEEDLFKIKDSDLWLIPTAEVPLTNFYSGEILKEEKSLTAFTPSFRSEAGSGGKDMKGLIRAHQFNKVEVVKIIKPENGQKAFNELLEHVGALLTELELPYRSVQLASRDLGFSAVETIDFEIWLPSEKRFRETSSVSYFGDFQGRRASMRFKVDNENVYAHTVNGSALAIDRIVASIIENYQNKDGSITVPKVLIPYMGKDVIDAKKK